MRSYAGWRTSSFERLHHVTDESLGKVAGHAAYGGGVFLYEAGEILRGLILLAPGKGAVAIEHVGSVADERDVGGDGDEVAGCLPAGGVVAQGSDGLREDRSTQRCVFGLF